MQSEEIIDRPNFPYLQGPREYQALAYENWCANNYKGVFAMATGTGKTITALNCVLNEYNINPAKTYHALILVPTITLVEQWAREAAAFNFQSVLTISSKVNWENEVTTLVSTSRRIPVSFILISTYTSFVKDAFQRVLKGLPEDTIFIADEAHNLASPQVIRRLDNFRLKRRIGLSATPKRIYDLEGTAEMELFFEDKEPYSFSFSMEKAIKENVLCQYYYYPHLIKLTPAELAEYIKISKKLISVVHFAKDKGGNSDIVEKLLLARKRIIHKASNKLEAAVDILKAKFQQEGSLKYTFVYVPEGQTFEVREEGNEPVEENIRIINQYIREIAKIDDRTLVNQFISGMPERHEILQQFQEGRIDVLASMKCLDEGVDIPRAQTAIFCSSTGNPRQFIQRRGRILRKHPDKEFAVIHDLVVLPDFEAQTAEEGAFELEKGLVRKELERVMYFASLSRNPYFTEDVFAAVCSYYNLNIYVIQSELAPT
jgi:superfamily II DNA or RNA helicase